MTTMPPWDPDAYDREVRAFRQRNKPRPPNKPPPNTGANTARYDGLARGRATEAELERRAEAERAMQRRADRAARVDELSKQYRANRAKRKGTVRWPQPTQKRNGRWVARFVEQGEGYCQTFDTREEAEQFINQVKGGQ